MGTVTAHIIIIIIILTYDIPTHIYSKSQLTTPECQLLSFTEWL